MDVDGRGMSSTSLRMSRTPGGTWWRLSGGTILVVLLKNVVSQRWNVLLATTAIEMRQRWVRARSPLEPPRFFWMMGLVPHTCSTIFGVRAFASSINKVKRASILASLHLSFCSFGVKTAVRLVRTAKLQSKRLTKEPSLSQLPCILAGQTPSTMMAKVI